MNVQEYISSGAIEACVVGLADEQDWIELEQMSALYPEVKQYKEVFEAAQEQLHIAAAVAPPPAIKASIFQKLDFPADNQPQTPLVHMQADNAAKPSVVPMYPKPKSMRWLQGAIAACILLLMGSVILNFYFYSLQISIKKQYAALLVTQGSLEARNKVIEASFNMVKDPEMKQVVMAATPAQPGAMATVYWDNRTKDVYLLVNRLPVPAPEKQYQLWAIVDGKPVSAGMVEQNAEGKMLLKMENIPNAQAFAITLENKGGSPAPTMEAMYVVGKV